MVDWSLLFFVHFAYSAFLNMKRFASALMVVPSSQKSASAIIQLMRIVSMMASGCSYIFSMKPSTMFPKLIIHFPPSGYFDARNEFILANCMDISFRLFAIVYITHTTKIMGATVIASSIKNKILRPSILLISSLFLFSRLF